MNPRDFHSLALRLANGTTPAEYRSAISRAYYAAYNVAVQFLEAMAIYKPKQGDLHRTLQNRLVASNDPEIRQVGDDLSDFHARRCKADYDMAHKGSESQQNALAAMKEASAIIAKLDSCPRNGDRWKQIRDSIKQANV